MVVGDWLLQTELAPSINNERSSDDSGSEEFESSLHRA